MPNLPRLSLAGLVALCAAGPATPAPDATQVILNAEDIEIDRVIGWLRPLPYGFERETDFVI